MSGAAHPSHRWSCILRWLAAGIACLPTIVLAGKLQLSPLSLTLKPGQRATTVTLRNEADAPTTFQVRVFAWSQDLDRGMVLEPTTSLVTSPPMATLAPGATQIIRLAQRTPQSVDQEQTFRVLIDELPVPDQSGRNAVKVLTRYSLPLFVEPPGGAQPRLAARLQSCTNGGRRIVIDNSGLRRARIANWRLLGGTQTLAVGSGLAGYALRQSALALPLPGLAENVAADLHLLAETDLGPWETAVSLHPEAAICASSDPGG